MREMFMGAVLFGTVLAASGFAETVKIDDLVVATSLPQGERDATIKAAKLFYQFWNTGDESALKAAIAPNFRDHTLPAGRPQGPQGPAFASEHFRAAVPDLSVEVRKMIVGGNYVTCTRSLKDILQAVLARPKATAKRSISSPPTSSK
jgi:SnoaL-like polyketide cyclase